VGNLNYPLGSSHDFIQNKMQISNNTVKSMEASGGNLRKNHINNNKSCQKVNSPHFP
jgi:hypothetical protein